MIVKYQNHEAWGFIDNVRQVANEWADHTALIKQYDEEVAKGEREDIASQVCSSDVANINKVFLMVIEKLPAEIKDEAFHTENLLSTSLLVDELPINVIILYLNDHKEYDTVVIITNQKCYLLNDNGKTIERLV